MSAPQAPWELAGECVVALARHRGDGRPPMPVGFCPLPGPWSLLAASYEGSPVGPYLELAVAEPARAGARLGVCVTTMVVDSSGSRQGGRLNWGFPKEVGRLAWSGAGDERLLHWKERDITVRAVAGGWAIPVVLPTRALQRRADGLVVVPARLRGWGRVSRVEVTVPEGDPLAGLAGHHRGLLVSGAKLVVESARRLSGVGATIRGPQTAPEPALSLGRSLRGD